VITKKINSQTAHALEPLWIGGVTSYLMSL